MGTTGRYWIGYYQNLGADLCNLSNGGEGKVGRKLSEESCQKLRDAFKGRPIPQEQREQISKSLTGKVQTTETVQRRLTKINERRIAAGLEPHKVGVATKSTAKWMRGLQHHSTETTS